MAEHHSVDEAAQLLARLVAIPSVNPAFRTPDAPAHWFGEAAMAEAVAAWLRDAGAEVMLDEVAPGRPNVIARLRRPGARRLLWEGHLDTVQATAMSIAPFDPVVRDGRLYGRGAVDDKGCLTSFMLALRALADDAAAPDLTFVAAIDEEYQFRGITHHLARNEPAEGGVAGEPTGLHVVSACKGCVRWEIAVHGRAAHSSRPQEGIDAISIATELWAALRREFAPRLAAYSHPLLGAASLVCTMIKGGEGPNTVPAVCTLTFDRRVLPGEAGVWHDIQGFVETFAASRDDGARVVMHAPFIDSIAMEVDPHSGIVAAAAEACREAGLPGEAIGVPFGSDASKMTRAGIPTIIFGPGDIAQAHTADEHVALAEVARAASLLAAMARRFADPP